MKNADKFWRKVERTPTCWLWNGPKNKSGYGYFSFGKQFKRAHRLSYEEVRGEIPKGMVLDHICRIRNCVNPDHLRIVTNAENVLIGIGPTAINARKTHCPQGHEYTKENTYKAQSKDAGRNCIICRKQRGKVRWQRNKVSIRAKFDAIKAASSQ